jgi:hypothetical protein
MTVGGSDQNDHGEVEIEGRKVHLCEVKEVGVLEKYGVEESCGRWVDRPHYS